MIGMPKPWPAAFSFVVRRSGLSRSSDVSAGFVTDMKRQSLSVCSAARTIGRPARRQPSTPLSIMFERMEHRGASRMPSVSGTAAITSSVTPAASAVFIWCVITELTTAFGQWNSASFGVILPA